MNNIDFYFSIGSTYTYLTVTRILDVEKKHQVKFKWIPFSVRIIMNELLHDDFKFTMHKSGNVLTKSDVIKWAMSGDINQDKVRIVYENDEVGIHHAFVTFNDGNVEAVMAVYKYDNGKIVSLETGATPMPK